MNYCFFNNLKFKFPIKLFVSEHFFLRKRFLIIKYLYNNLLTNISFFKSIKYLNNNYYTILQLFFRIKKHNSLSRNNLSYSTKKLYQQKGLGRARSGSLKSPLRKGGSIVFGPIARTLNIMLQAKKKNISFFFLVLNKRTYISFIFLLPIMHTFINFNEYLNQQKRINGFFSLKLLYVLLYKTRHIIQKEKLPLVSIKSLNFNYFIKYDYIIFLI